MQLNREAVSGDSELNKSFGSQLSLELDEQYPNCSSDQIKSCKGKCQKESKSDSGSSVVDESSDKHKGCMSFCLKLQVVATDSSNDNKTKITHKRKSLTLRRNYFPKQKQFTAERRFQEAVVLDEAEPAPSWDLNFDVDTPSIAID